MPGLPATGAEALVLRQAERSLKDVLELIQNGALDPAALGSLAGLCEGLARTHSVPRVDATVDDGEAEEAEEEPEALEDEADEDPGVSVAKGCW